MQKDIDTIIPQELDLSPINLFKDNDNYFLPTKELKELLKKQGSFGWLRGKTYKQSFLHQREKTIAELEKAVSKLYSSDSDFEGLILYGNLTRIINTVFNENDVEIPDTPALKFEYEPYIPADTAEIKEIMKKFILLDLETTGFWRLDQIIQVGVGFYGEKQTEVEYFPSTLLRKSEFFVELYKNTVTPRITAITGITNKDLRDKGKSIRSVLKFLYQVIDWHVVAAHNARFDFGKVAELFIDFGIEPPKPSKLIDTIDLFKVMSKEKNWKLSQFNLNKMAKEFLGLNIENMEERHTAMFDVLITHQALLAATKTDKLKKKK